MRVLGLDVGDRRIGVALSDSLGLTAQRLTVLARQSLPEDVTAVAALVQQHGVELVVIGLPLTLRGTQGPQAQKVSRFSAALEGGLPVPVRLIDERLTTVEGTRMLMETHSPKRKRKQMIDQVAAQLILQQFLERRRDPGHP